MQADAAFSYQIVNRTSIKSGNLEKLKDCIANVVDTSDDLQSDDSKTAISEFQNCVESQYIEAKTNGTDDIYVNSLFSVLSFESQHQDTYAYLVLMTIIISTRMCTRKTKAQHISRDIISIKPCNDPKSWIALEKILIWLIEPLGTSLHLALFPLRDKIWKWYFTNDHVSIISSLELINIFFKHFDYLLENTFDSVLSLLVYCIQDSDTEIHESTEKVIKSSLSLINTHTTIPINTLFETIRQKIETSDKDTDLSATIMAFNKIFDADPSKTSIMRFTTNMIDRISPGDDITLLYLIPFVHRCSPHLYKPKDIEKIFEAYKMLMIQYPSKRNAVHRAIGDIGFLMSTTQRALCRDSINKLLPSLGTLESKECIYAFLSLVDPTDSSNDDFLKIIFEQKIRIHTAFGLKKFVQRWPSMSSVVNVYIIKELNTILLTQNDPVQLARALRIMSLFEFTRDEISEQLIEQYALALRHPNPVVREKAASFMVNQQKQFPEATFRLIAFVSIEVNQRLRSSTLNSIHPSSEHAAPLFSLLHDKHKDIVYKVLSLLCDIKTALPLLREFASYLVNRSSKTNTYERHIVECLLVMAEQQREALSTLEQTVLINLLEQNHQSSSSLRLLSILIEDRDFDEWLPRLESFASDALDLDSSFKKISAGLDLISVLLNSQTFRKNLFQHNLYVKMLNLFDKCDMYTIKEKTYSVLVRVGKFSHRLIRSLMNNIERTPIIPMLTDTDFSDLYSYSISIALSCSLEVFEKDELSGLQSDALESLLIILKKYKRETAAVHDAILEKIQKIVHNAHPNTVPIVLHNVPTLIRIFDKKSVDLVPDLVNLIMNSWGKVDMQTLLTGIEWMAYKLPKAVQPYTAQLISLFCPLLQVCNNAEAVSIFSCIASFQTLAASVDYLVMPHLITWIEAHINDTETASTVLESFTDFLKCINTAKFCANIFQTLMMIIKENVDLVPKVVDVLSVLAVQMGNNFTVFIPEILQLFDLKSFDEFWRIIECISTHVDFPPEMIKEHCTPRKKSQFMEHDPPTIPHFSYDLPEFEMPLSMWDPLEWSRWVSRFVSLLISKSPSKAISACAFVCERNFNARLAMFPVSFALCVSEAGNPEPLHKLLNIVMTAPGLPSHARTMFMKAIEVMVLHNIEMRVPLKTLCEAAIRSKDYAFAMRCCEKRMDADLESLIKVDILLGKRNAAKTFIKNSKYFDSAEVQLEVGDWEKALKIYEDSKQPDCEPQMLNCLVMQGRFEEIKERELGIQGKIVAALFNLDFDSLKDYIHNPDKDLNYKQKTINALIALKEQNIPKVKEYINEVRNEIFPIILNNPAKSDIIATKSIGFSMLLCDIEEAAHIIKLRNKLTNAPSRDRNRIIGEIRRIKDNWNDKVYNDPLMRFACNSVHSLVLEKDELAVTWSSFALMCPKKYDQMYRIALKQISAADEIEGKCVKLYEERKPQALQKIIEEMSNEEQRMRWKCILSNWLIEDGKPLNIIDANECDNLTALNVWISAAIDLKYNINEINQMINKAIRMTDDTRSLSLKLLLLIESNPGVEYDLPRETLQSFVELLPEISFWHKRPIFERMLKGMAEIDFTAVIRSILRYLLLDDPSIEELRHAIEAMNPDAVKDMIFFGRECIRLSLTKSEQFLQAVNEAMRKRDFSTLKKFYEMEEFTNEDKKFFINHRTIIDSARAAFEKQHAKDESISNENVAAAHAPLLRARAPALFSAEESSLLADLTDRTLIVPGCSSRLVSVGDIEVIDASRSKLLHMSAIDGTRFFLEIRNRPDSIDFDRLSQLVRLCNHLLRSSNSVECLQIPVYDFVPLSSSIAIVGGSPSAVSVENAIMGRRRKLSVSVDERDLAPEKYDSLTGVKRLEAYRAGLKATTGMEIESFIVRGSVSASHWAERRQMYVGCTAAQSSFGSVVGLEERVPSNILLTHEACRVVHLGAGRCLRAAGESIPFRMTRIIVNGLDPSGPLGEMRALFAAHFGVIRRQRSMFALLADAVGRCEGSSMRGLDKFSVAVLECDSDEEAAADRLIREATDENNIAKMTLKWNPWW